MVDNLSFFFRTLWSKLASLLPFFGLLDLSYFFLFFPIFSTFFCLSLLFPNSPFIDGYFFEFWWKTKSQTCQNRVQHASQLLGHRIVFGHSRSHQKSLPSALSKSDLISSIRSCIRSALDHWMVPKTIFCLVLSPVTNHNHSISLRIAWSYRIM